MVSSFYSSNQEKLKKYVADRRVEEHNGDIQQAKVYQAIAEQQGDLEQADRLAKLGMTVLGKVAATEVPIINKQGGVSKMTVKEHILSMIEAGTLSNWWEAIKRIPPAKLSKKARIVQDDIKHNELLKQSLNELVSKIALSGVPGAKPLFKQEGIVPSDVYTNSVVSNKMDNMIDEVIKLLTGGDESTMDELDTKAEEANANVARSIQQQKIEKGIKPTKFDVKTLSTEQTEQVDGDTFISADWFNNAKAKVIKEVFKSYNSDDYPKVRSNWSNIRNLRPILRSILEKEGSYLKAK